MKPFEKHYAFGFLTIIHPSGHTDKVTIEKLETELLLIDNSLLDLHIQRKNCLDDLVKISSKSRIKRFFIKRKVAKNGKTQTEKEQP